MDELMKLSKTQLRRIIREEKEKLQELDFSGPARGDDSIAQLTEAVRQCVLSGMSEADIFEAVEDAYMIANMDERF